MTVIVAGATGLAGSTIVKAFESKGQSVIGINRAVVDLMDAKATEDFITKTRPSLIVDAAAKLVVLVRIIHFLWSFSLTT